ncbi:MAG: nucleotidyltransferase domain-containing protein [Gemmatimonadetes bacterium]|nr:nucleotidyltransferase domain-containing protein [Gemmatimonadota bacterium]
MLPVPPPLHAPLGVVLGTRAKVDLLRVLTAGGAPLSQRELARRAGVALRSAQAALADLCATGVARKLEGGRDHLTLLNERHRLAPALIALFRAEAEVPLGVRQALATLARGDGSPPLGVYLFGSVARGEETVESDLDVLLVARNAAHRELLLERLLAGADTLAAEFGVTASPLAYTLGEARRGWKAGAAPWPDLARDVLPVLGPPLAELLG